VTGQLDLVDQLDAICTYLGGPLNTDTLDHRSSTIDGVGYVRRGPGGLRERERYFLADVDTRGALVVVTVRTEVEHRQTMGPPGSVLVAGQTVFGLYVYPDITSTEPVESQADSYRLVARIKAFLRADPAAGTGGFEAGGVTLSIGTLDAMTTSYDLPVHGDGYTEPPVLITVTGTTYFTG
jgi:hypothetical protein